MRRLILGLLAILFVCGTVVYWGQEQRLRATTASDSLLLLIPDQADAKDPAVTVWLDAAGEEGLHMSVIRDSEFLRRGPHIACAGLVIPDLAHKQANDILVGGLEQYVNQGGHLFLTYDAATLSLQGLYPPHASRLSAIAGVHYALYDTQGSGTIAWSTVSGTSNTMHALRIPPGKYPFDGIDQNGASANPKLLPLTTYHYGNLHYPVFRTEGTYDGRTLLFSENGVAAGIHRYGSGDVLFVNLPLGNLALHTDGLLLHCLLRYFALDRLQLPYMDSAPDGVGGVVMNWHIDSRYVLPAVQQMYQAGVFRHGPFSIDITAGPDLDLPHDGHGIDVDHNPEARRWIQFFLSRGYSVGSHGGWIHNYFGSNVSESNEKEFIHYLVLNKSSIEAVTHQPVTEYSAPVGNQPKWVTRWLEQNGVLGYYFVGNTGMGPTQTYRDGVKQDQTIWSFPILPLGDAASLEEMRREGQSEKTVSDWFSETTSFVAQEHEIRLLYSHPQDVPSHFESALKSWFQQTDALAEKGEFRWYTVPQVARFLSSRSEARWVFQRDDHGVARFEATHPQSLAHITWIFPKQKYGKPILVSGIAEVHASGDNWLVVAGGGKDLKLELRVPSEVAANAEQGGKR
jgi:hypothetical protein